MSLAQGFPNTFSATQQTQEVLKNTDNETKKIYTDINSLMAVGGHAHTGNGSDGAKISASNIANQPAGNITATYVQTALNELDAKKAPSGYGIGLDNQFLSDNTNFNNVDGSGFFNFFSNGSALNAPTNESCYWLIINTRRNSGAKLQIATNVTKNNTYARTYLFEIWSPWKSFSIPTATSSEAVAGTDNTKMITPLQLRNGLNAGGTAPIYACRAWCNFYGTPLAGTYSQSSITVTVTMTDHKLSVGDKVNLSITSGTGVSGTYVVATVPNANTYTYTASTSLTTSGNVTRNIYIKASGNVSSITDNGVGSYGVNFIEPMIDADYVITGIASIGSAGPAGVISQGASTVSTASTAKFQVGNTTSGTVYDATNATIAII